MTELVAVHGRDEVEVSQTIVEVENRVRARLSPLWRLLRQIHKDQVLELAVPAFERRHVQTRHGKVGDAGLLAMRARRSRKEAAHRTRPLGQSGPEEPLLAAGQAGQLAHRSAIDLGRIRLAHAPVQVVRLVHDQDERIARALAKVPADERLGVEHEIVVARDHVHALGEAQRDLKGAYPGGLGPLDDGLPVDHAVRFDEGPEEVALDHLGAKIAQEAALFRVAHAALVHAHGFARAHLDRGDARAPRPHEPRGL